MIKHKKSNVTSQRYALPVYQLRTYYDNNFEDAISLGETMNPWPAMIKLAADEASNAKKIGIVTRTYINTASKTIRVDYVQSKTCTNYFALRI